MILFIDELDAKLHPLLTRYIINLFHNSETNIGNGQLIYSTHDTVNLNKILLEEMKYGLPKKTKMEYLIFILYLTIYFQMMMKIKQQKKLEMMQHTIKII